MEINIFRDQSSLGREAGVAGAALISSAIEQKGEANIILATGASQFETLSQLLKEDVDWSRVVMFHLDEYIGLPESSPASFRKYLKERFLSKAPPLRAAYLVNGEGDPAAECVRLGNIIRQHPIDVAFVGVGENGHLAFNDPPADFDVEDPYIIVTLDEQCRRQQFNEGWFTSVDTVPRTAISMSVQQVMKSKHILCSVPDTRKAIAVRDCIEKPVSNLFPASILQLHPDCRYYLDNASASLLQKNKTVHH